ncbi:hypothetical protein HPO96_28985 [Kribbella sandramycini]|uniref:Uncharacterized protein n=1 Tax=Kribbella sandramycini TaxID=60450 RepID=A0A7Y4L6M8_9ACTN|nr:hypothetical protein [Kribbella sandramycini]MBB6571646.1 hypothetical protein [Kribbella sandramycini]NOL44291.1 hypothetical protein [Kribbella sandramycini]
MHPADRNLLAVLATRALFAVGALGLVVAAIGGYFLMVVTNDQGLARRLNSAGVSAQVTDVEVGHRMVKSKNSPPQLQFDGARVTFRTAGGESVTTVLAAARSDRVVGFEGRHPPVPGSAGGRPAGQIQVLNHIRLSQSGWGSTLSVRIGQM